MKKQAVETTGLVHVELQDVQDEIVTESVPLIGEQGEEFEEEMIIQDEMNSTPNEDTFIPPEESEEDGEGQQEEEDDPAAKKKVRKGTSPLKICFNLLNTTLGAGCVTVPYAVSTVGVIASPILLIVFAFFSSYCLFLLLQANVHFKGELRSYRDIGSKVLKSKCLGKFLEFFIFANTFGILAGYIVIVGEYASSLLQTWVNTDKKWLNDSFLGTQFTSFAVLFVLMFPMSLLRKMSLLSYTSVFGLLSVLFVTVIIIVRYFQLGCIPFEKWDLYPTEFADASTAIPLFIFSYSNHFAYLPLLSELKGDISIHMNSYVIFLVTVVCTLVYLVIGVFGYLLFGPQIQDNVLMSFPNTDLLTQFGKIFILLVLVVSYPLIFFTSRDSLLVLCCGTKGRNANCCCWVFLSIVLSIMSWGLAVAVPMVSVILGFTASTFFIVINFILPFVSAMKTQKSWSMWFLHLILCFVFAIVGVISTVGVVMDYIEKTFLTEKR